MALHTMWTHGTTVRVAENAGGTYWFHFTIPTPCRQARLLRVLLLWEARSGAHPLALHVLDGPNRIAELPMTLPVDGLSRFELDPHAITSSVGVSVGVAFDRDGDITFFAAGAAFDA
jgi:hypothetical protein